MKLVSIRIFALFVLLATACSSNRSTVVPSDFTSAALATENTVLLNASPEVVWSYLTDYPKLPEYIPGVIAVEEDGANAEEPNGVGTRRRVTMAQPDGSTIVLDEEIVAFEPERVLGYSVIDGNSLGIRNHLALVRLERDESGTRLSWSQYFSHDDLEMMRGAIGQAMDVVASNLVATFGGTDLSN